MYKKCLENRITRNGGDYKCYLCHHIMKHSLFDVVEEHLLSDTHKKKLNQIDEKARKIEMDNSLKLRKIERKRIVKNLITFEKDFLLKCHVCKCKINGLPNTLQHINGSTHKENLISFTKECNKDVEQKMKKASCDKITANKTAVEKIVTVKSSIFTLPSGSNDIIFDEPNKSYYCNICKMRIIATPNISQHTQGLLHQALESKLKDQNSSPKSDYIIYNEKSNSYYCTICQYKINSTSNITQHIQGLVHQTALKAGKGMTIKLDKTTSQGLLNQTTLKTQKALQINKVDNKDQVKGNLDQIDHKSHFTEICYCKTCQTFIDESTKLKCHMLLHLYEEFDSLKNLDLIEFKLKPNKKLHLECLLCNFFICDLKITMADQELAKHFKTDMHLGRLALFDYIKNSKIPAVSNQVIDINLENSIYKPKNISFELFCNACNVPVFLNNTKEHASGKNHNKKVSEIAKNNAIQVKKTGFNSKENLDYYNCFFCDISFSESASLLKHFKQPEHQWKLISLNMINKCPYIKFTKYKTLDVIECSSCKVIMNDFKTAINHMIGKRHNKKLKFPSVNLQNQKNSNTTLLAQVVNEFEKLSVTPKNVSSKLVNSANTTADVPVIKGKSVKKIKAASTFEASVEELNQLGFSGENIQPLSTLNPDTVDKLLGDLVSADFNKSQTKRLLFNAKLKLPRTPKVEDQGNSFAMNVLRYGKTYIKFCIDPGHDNIFNFDNEKIALMKLGVSLTFLINSDRGCISCGEKFTNNIQSLFEHLQNQEHLKNLCNMLVDDKEFEKFPEQFSDLRLAKLYMHLSYQSIQCHACDIEIKDDDDIIRKHAKMPIHEEKSKLWKEESDQLFNQYMTIYNDIWYYAEVFFCEICKTRCKFEIDFAIHLTHPEHMKKVYELKHKGIALKFDLCPPCTTYWFGKVDSYEAHCKNNFHKLLVDKKDFIVPNLTISASEYLDNIDIKVDLLVSESDKVDMQKDKVFQLLEAIVEAVIPTYPDVEAYVFGSRLSHLGFPDSDVDIFLDCGNVYYTSSTKKQSQEYIKSVKCYFDNNPNTWKVDEVLIPTRVPILKMRHIPTNLHCDISFVNGLSIEKSKLIRIYNCAFPICRKMILFMKKWLTLCRLSGPDCITTFAISWCVIFYFQLQGVLPSVHELIKRKTELKIVDGWECGFEETITAGTSSFSFKEHLRGFFTYFANFDYQKGVMCPYVSKNIDKHMFAYTDKLPSEMDIYKRRLKDNEVDIFRFDSPMCIQDPIDLSQNLTKALSKKHLRCFRQYCILSAAKC